MPNGPPPRGVAEAMAEAELAAHLNGPKVTRGSLRPFVASVEAVREYPETDEDRLATLIDQRTKALLAERRKTLNLRAAEKTRRGVKQKMEALERDNVALRRQIEELQRENESLRAGLAAGPDPEDPAVVPLDFERMIDELDELDELL